MTTRAPDEGNTRLDGDELDGLIPAHIRTRTELNQWEALNIARANDWLLRRRRSDVLDVAFLRAVHRRMFDQTWMWAGTFRQTDKNISPHSWTIVPMLMRDLIENTRAQYNAGTREPAELDDMAMRFHHALVRIHPWPNGNGRHARLATDLLLRHWGRPPFTWGGGDDPVGGGDSRSAYIAALQHADAGEFEHLRKFVRS